MRIIRWIAVLIISMFLMGCGLLEAFLMSSSYAEPTPAPPLVDAEPPTLFILHGDLVVPMHKGSFCWGTAESSLCVDVAVFPPGYSADDHQLVIGDTLELLFEAPFPDTVRAELYPMNNTTTDTLDIPGELTLNEYGRVSVTVPDGVSGNYALLVFAAWTSDGRAAQGDVSYAAPVRFEP